MAGNVNQQDHPQDAASPSVGSTRVGRNRPQKADEDISDDAETLSALLTATPNLRAKFFADPTHQIGKSLPPAKSWNYRPSGSRWLPWFWPGSPFRYYAERQRLAKNVLQNITDQVKGGDQSQAISASVNTDSVFEEYFAPIVRVSQRSFTSVYFLSLAAFAAGVALIGIGAFVAISPRTGTNSTVVASIFGGSGAISALGAVYAMATAGIREATLDHARVRLVLTAFATQLGQLRAIIEKPPPQSIPEAKLLNDYIGVSMNAALLGIPSPVELKAAESQSSDSGNTNGSLAKDSAGSNSPPVTLEIPTEAPQRFCGFQLVE